MTGTCSQQLDRRLSHRRPWSSRPKDGVRAALAALVCRSQKPDKYAAAKRVFTEEDYMATQQAAQREQWASSVRKVTGSRHHQFWEPCLDPPALLSQVTVVLVSPRRPVSVGTVARACSCFEVEDIRIVQPRCEHISRHSKSASKGAQFLLYRATPAASLQEATADCDLRVAFTRWVQGCPLPHYHLAELMSTHPIIQQLVMAPVGSTQPSSSSSTPHQPPVVSTNGSVTGISSNWCSSSSSSSSHSGDGGSTSSAQPPRLALVFGREELGLSDDEVAACDVVCSIPIGRLQESLSLSHAVTLALSGLFQQRLSYISQLAACQQAATGPEAHSTQGTSSTGLPSSARSASELLAAYTVQTPDGLAAGFDATVGQER